jgi:hypothetical protein
MHRRDIAPESEYTSARMPYGGRSLLVVCAALAPAFGALASATSGAAQELAPSSSASTASSASTTSAPPPSPSSSAPPLRRHEEPTEVQIIDLTDEPEPDPQAFAIGLQAGGGVFHTKHGDTIEPAADFAFTFDLGLGPGGAHIPWTLEPFASFALTRASFSGTIDATPDRWTEIGVRLVWRGEGALEGHWLSLGVGGVWTSYNSKFERSCAFLASAAPCTETAYQKLQLSPAPLVEIGVGIKEWTARVARYGFMVRAPF